MKQLSVQQSRILSVSKTASVLIVENASDFLPFGYTVEVIAAYNSKIVKANEISSDLTERNELKLLTIEKEQKMKSSYKWCKDLILRMELAFPENSEVLKSFPRKKLRKVKKNESKLPKLMKTYLELAEKHTAELLPHGQTPEVIQEGNDLLSELDQAETTQEVRKIHKLNVTAERNDIFFDLYKSTIDIYKIARNIYADNPEKLVMFKSPWPKHSSAQSLVYEGFVDPLSSLEIAEGISQESELHIENKGTTELMFYMSNNGEENEGFTVSAGENKNILLSAIGEGKYLKVLNKGETEKGEYKIEV